MQPMMMTGDGRGLLDHLLAVDDEDTLACVVDADALKVVDDVIAICCSLDGVDACSSGAVNVGFLSEAAHAVGRADGQLVDGGVDVNLEAAVG